MASFLVTIYNVILDKLLSILTYLFTSCHSLIFVKISFKIFQFICQFVIGNGRQTVIKAAFHIVQLIYQLASKELEKCIPSLLFCFADTSLVPKGNSVWQSLLGTTPVQWIGQGTFLCLPTLDPSFSDLWFALWLSHFSLYLTTSLDRV